MSKRSFAHLEYGFDDDLVEDSDDDLVDFDDDLLEDSDEQEQVRELVEPQAKKLKQSTQQLETNPLRDFEAIDLINTGDNNSPSYDSQLFEDREAVVIILDSSHHDHDFYYLNRNLLEIKLQSTSFLISEFSKPKYERFLNETSHEIFCDYKVRSALVRITGELNLSPRIIQLIKRKRFDELPIEMKTDRNVILQLLANYPNFGELLDHISDDLQNDIQFLLKAFKIVQKNEEISELTLPKMKLSIAIDWMKMDNSLFQIIPKRFKKTIEFIPFIVTLVEEDLSVVEELWMDEEYIFSNNPLTVLYHEILEDKDLALYYINYIFQNEELKQCSYFCEYKKHKLLGREIIERMSFEAMKKIVESDGEFIQHAREEWKDNKEMAMIAVKQSASSFQFISKRLKMDQEILLEAIKSDLREVSQYLTQDLMNDKHFILQAIEYNANIVKYISNELQQDKEIWMKALKFRKSMKDTDIKFRKLKSMKDADFTVPLEFERDRDVFKLMIECGLFSEYNIFRNDRELMLECVKHNPQEFKGLPFNLRSDREIAKIAISQDGSMLAHTPNELQNDRELVESAVQKNGTYLACASELFKKDKQIVLMAVKQNGLALKFASEELKNDKQIVLEAISNNVNAIEFIGPDLINDRDIALIGVKHKHYLSLVSNELRNDKQIVLNSVRFNARSIIYASEELQKDPDIILQAIITYYQKRKNIFTRKWISMLIPMKYKNDSQFMVKIITECDTDLITLASDELKTNEDFILELISHRKFKMSNISKELLMRNTFIKRLLIIDLDFLKYIPEEVQKTKEVALTIIEFLGKVEEHEISLSVSDLERVLDVFNNKELFTKILKTCPEIDYNEYYQKCSNFKNDRDIILLLCELDDVSVSSYIDFGDWETDEEIMKVLIQKSVSYVLELEFNSDNFDKTLMKYALCNINNYADEKFQDEKLQSKIVELLKKPQLNCQILLDIFGKIEFDKQKEEEIMFRNPYLFEIDDKEMIKQLAIHFKGFPFKALCQELKSDRNYFLELMEYEAYRHVDFSKYIDYEWKRDKEFIAKASMTNIHLMFNFSYCNAEESLYHDTLRKYLNKECHNKAHLIDNVMRFALNFNSEKYNENSYEGYESD